MTNKTVTGLYIIAFAVLAPLIAAPLAMLSRDYENTLENHPRWGASKKRVTMELMSADRYAADTQALAGNRLNLDAWHGYHEVMYRDAVAPKSATFRFYLEENGYLYFIFKRPRPYAYTEEHYCALRFSCYPHKESGLFHVAASGEFLERAALETDDALRNRAWNDAVVDWNNESGAIEVTLNGRFLGAFPGDFSGGQHIGFRGGAHTARVDRILIEEQDGARHATSFSWHEGVNRGSIMRIAVSNLLKIAPAIILVVALLRVFTGSLRTAAAIVLSCCATAALTLWPWSLYHLTVMNARYPVVDESLERAEQLFREEDINLIKREILQTHPMGAAYPEGTIMLVGSSQAWGSGASIREYAWAHQLEKTLNADNGEFVIVNGSIRGARTIELYPFYEEFLSQYPHKILVIALGCNDKDGAIFYDNLVRFVEKARRLRVKPLFIIEALSYEQVPDGPEGGPFMEAVAKAFDIPVFDLHKAVAPYQDAGIFWWDVVHPTSFGHACIARELAPFIRNHL